MEVLVQDQNRNSTDSHKELQPKSSTHPIWSSLNHIPNRDRVQQNKMRGAAARVVNSLVFSPEEAKYLKAIFRWTETSSPSDDPDEWRRRQEEEDEKKRQQLLQQKPAGELRILVIGAKGTGKSALLTWVSFLLEKKHLTRFALLTLFSSSSPMAPSATIRRHPIPSTSGDVDALSCLTSPMPLSLRLQGRPAPPGLPRQQQQQPPPQRQPQPRRGKQHRHLEKHPSPAITFPNPQSPPAPLAKPATTTSKPTLSMPSRCPPKTSTATRSWPKRCPSPRAPPSSSRCATSPPCA
jgi:hypothetical protein